MSIDQHTPLQAYEVGSEGVLTANNARTLQIRTATGGQVNLNATEVTATGATDTALSLRGGNAVINGGSITSAYDGFNLGTIAGSGVGSSGQITGGAISAGNRGIVVSSLSSLLLDGTQVSSQRVGAELFGSAAARMYRGSITGQTDGLRLRGDQTLPGTVDLQLEQMHVEGVEGAALVIGLPTSAAQARVLVANGSTLVGGNGHLVEVNSGSTLDMTVDNSQLEGDLVVAPGGTASLTLQNQASLTGRLENLASLALNSQARWNMVEDGQVENLSMDGGSVRLGGAQDFYTLTVGNLSGNGTFLMDVDFGQAHTDFLDVTGQASGNHSLLIGSTGSDPLSDTSLHLVHTAGGDATFSLAGGAVDLGTWSYDLIKQGEHDWYLDATTRTVSPGAGSVIALYNAAPTVWYGELSTLRSRMGELRFNGGQPGLWMRSYSNRFSAEGAAGVGYRQNQSGLSLGADSALPWGDGQWLAGVMAGYSDSDLNLERGSSGSIDSYYAGAYATWLDSDSGYYFDGVAKVNRLRNESKVNLSDGTRTEGRYANWATGVSMEFGRHLRLEQDWFVEPYTQWSAMIAQGRDYSLDNGMRAEGDRARSLLGKAGATLGRDISLGQGRGVQPYVRAAVAHEFIKNNRLQVNDNSFNNNLSGARGELGLGAAVSLSEAFQLHADFEYSNGSRIDQPWGVNLGLRYAW